MAWSGCIWIGCRRRCRTGGPLGAGYRVSPHRYSGGISRDEIFITTKVRNSDQGYDSTLKAFDDSRSKLDVDVVDLYLIHWPIKGMYLDTWKALEYLHSKGKIRTIGVSNFLSHHLEDLFNNFDIVPAVNQVEFHPFLLQQDLLDFDAAHDILHEAWSPLTRGQRLEGHGEIRYLLLIVLEEQLCHLM